MNGAYPYDDPINRHKAIWGDDYSESVSRAQSLAQSVRATARFAGLPFFRKPSDDGALYYVHVGDPFRERFFRDPTPAGRVRGLVIRGSFRSYHTFGTELYFAPTVAEVLAQMPALLVDEALAFEIVEWPRRWEDLMREKAAFEERLHVALVRVYGLERYY